MTRATVGSSSYRLYFKFLFIIHFSLHLDGTLTEQVAVERSRGVGYRVPVVISALRGPLTVVPAGGQAGGEQLDVQQVVLTHRAQVVVNDPLGAGAQEVAELRSVRV